MEAKAAVLKARRRRLRAVTSYSRYGSCSVRRDAR